MGRDRGAFQSTGRKQMNFHEQVLNTSKDSSFPAFGSGQQRLLGKVGARGWENHMWTKESKAEMLSGRPWGYRLVTREVERGRCCCCHTQATEEVNWVPGTSAPGPCPMWPELCKINQEAGSYMRSPHLKCHQ